MIIRLLTISLLTAILLSATSTLYSGDTGVVKDNQVSQHILNDYYHQFDQVIIKDEKCDCPSDIGPKKNPLDNYYSELLK